MSHAEKVTVHLEILIQVVIWLIFSLSIIKIKANMYFALNDNYKLL